jgi:ppGpp synthetase/RelA/SpoT-type nucleotidyltranferase
MENLKDFYSQNIKNYELAAEKIETIIKDILKSEHIQFSSVSSRVKTLDSYLKKSENYKDPKNQITDYIGVRVITYVLKDMEKIISLIEKEFKIDTDKSINKSKALGNDKMGYRSIHYIASLSDDRIKLSEYSVCKDCCFEIQIRTILQHTCAEIEHDKNYKYSGVLPNDIKRRLNLLSAVLESADNEFNTISQEIDDYVASVNNDIQNDRLNDIELNSASLKEYLQTKYGEYKFFQDPIDSKLETQLISELNSFGIVNLKGIEELINKNYLDYHFAINVSTNVLGIMRDLMIIKDADRYFTKSFDHSWGGMKFDSKELLEKFNPQIATILEKYQILVMRRK